MALSLRARYQAQPGGLLLRPSSHGVAGGTNVHPSSGICPYKPLSLHLTLSLSPPLALSISRSRFCRADPDGGPVVVCVVRGAKKDGSSPS